MTAAPLRAELLDVELHGQVLVGDRHPHRPDAGDPSQGRLVAVGRHRLVPPAAPSVGALHRGVEIATAVSTPEQQNVPTKVEATVKYLILIHSNPQFLQRWEGLSDAHRGEFGRGHFALPDELAASGELIVSEGLADPALAKRVTARDGQVMTSDGPFAEVKEHLAGFYLVDCESTDRAVQIAARVRTPCGGWWRYDRCWT